MKMLFFSIEVNLLLWLAVVGMLFADPLDVSQAKTMTIIGCGIAAVIQHWAFYNIRKKSN